MHDRLRDDLWQLIDELTDQEKLDLIDQLRASVRPDEEAVGEAEIAARQRAAMRAALERIAKLPRGHDPYALLGYSNEAHDKILYDLEQ